jgi:hypothetical protein
VAAIYNRHSYAEEKRRALEAWGHFVMELVGATKVLAWLPRTAD